MEKKKFILTDAYKQNAFEVPKGYFDVLEEKVTERIAVVSQPQPSWRKALRPQLAFAAGFVALVIAGYGGLHLLNQLKSPAIKGVSEDIYAYADMLDIDENAVINLMTEKKHDPSIETDAIINYLADANISLTDIASLE